MKHRNFITLMCSTFALLAMPLIVLAQPPVHYQNRADMPSGAIGRSQFERGGPFQNYFQPVEVRVPEGSIVSLAAEGDFLPSKQNVALGGMLIGQVYRLKVAYLTPEHEVEVFPSIELVDRLYPPPGQETRFPVPVEITAEDLALAAEGKFVTRVIYLEDPRNPLPVRELPGHEQRVTDSLLNQDPLQVADQMGRPMAILRLGSRVPQYDSNTGKFLFGSPPLQIYQQAKPELPPEAGLEKPAELIGTEPRAARRHPRLPVR
jgi:hypothetical protein